MKIYASLPTDLEWKDLSKLWCKVCHNLEKSYPGSEIISNCTSEGVLDEADIVIFLSEYKDHPNCQHDYARCRNLGKIFNILTKVYTPERGGDYMDFI